MSIAPEIAEFYSHWSTPKLQRHLQVIHDLLHKRGAISRVREPQEPVKQIEKKECPDHLTLLPIDSEPVKGVNIDFGNLRP